MNPLIIGGLILGVLWIAYFLLKNSSVAQTPAGGVTAAGTPSAIIPLPPDGVIASVATVTPPQQPVTPPAKLVKKIIITKDMVKFPGSTGRWLNIGEVYAYEGSRLLTASDFSDAILFPDIRNDPNDPMVPLGLASNAIDGNPATVAHSGTEGAPLVTLTLILKNPTALTQVNVLNRQDCCYDRLEGAALLLVNEAGETIFNQSLKGIKDLQLFPVSV
jgi:hypothetical protein